MKVLQFTKRFLFIIALCSSLTAADSIQLRNGRHLQGKYIGGTTTMIGFMTSGAVEYFATSEVLALVFDSTDSPLNGLQPNHMNGNSTSQTPMHNMSARPRKRQSQSRLKQVNAILPPIVD